MKIKIIITITTILVIFLGIYIANSYSEKATNEDGNCISTNLGDANQVKVETIGLLPQSDESALKSEGQQIEIKNNCSTEANYVVNIVLNYITNVETNKVKIGLNDNIYLLSSLTSTSSKGVKTYSTTTYTIQPNETVTVTYRSWEDEYSYEVSAVERTISTNITIKEEF